MSSLIRIPDVERYATAILLLAGLGSSTLAIVVRQQLARFGAVGFFPSYALVLALVAAGAAAIGRTLPLLPHSLGGALVSLPLGLVCGAAAFFADRAITRAWFRRQLRRRTTRSSSSFRAAAAAVPPRAADDAPRAWLVTVGALEEIAFRGALLGWALTLPSPALSFAVVAAITIVFALTHVQFGWIHVLAKLPLSLITVAVSLATGSVLAAVLAHMFFNDRVWLELDRRGTHVLRSR